MTAPMDRGTFRRLMGGPTVDPDRRAARDAEIRFALIRPILRAGAWPLRLGPAR